MSQLRHRISLSAFVVFAAFSGGIVAQEARDAISAALLEQRVPAFVADAGRRSPLDLAAALAVSGVPAGFVLNESETVNGVSKPWQHEIRGAELELKAVLNAVAQHTPTLQALEIDRTLVFAEKGLSISATPLMKRVPSYLVDHAAAPQAFFEATRAVEPGIPARSGVVGSIPSRPGERPNQAVAPTVSLDMKNASFVEILNAVARASKGGVWILRRRAVAGAPATYALSVNLPDGTTVTYHDEIR